MLCYWWWCWFCVFDICGIIVGDGSGGVSGGLDSGVILDLLLL